MSRLFTRFATRAAHAAGHPLAFSGALLIILIWGASGPVFGFSDTWQLVINTSTTIVTFLMVFLIQNSQNRDSAAIQAKLDELIRAVSDARNEFIGIEHLSEDELAEVLRGVEDDVAAATEGDARGEALERLRASFARMRPPL